MSAAAAEKAARDFAIESWTLLSIGLIITIARTYHRIKAVGVDKLQADDYLVILAAALYITETALANSVASAAHGLANNDMTAGQRASISPSDIEYQFRVLGSKIQVAGWTVYGSLLWSLKASLLVFYIRLTAGLPRHYRIRIYVGFALVGLSYFIMLMNLFLSCRPLHRFWQINPDPGETCYPAISRQIVWGFLALNIATDAYLLSIPIPMLWGSSLQIWKKIGLITLFSGGLVITAFAILRCVLIITDPVNGAQLAGSWAVRETFVAILSTNLPVVFPLVRNVLGPYFGVLLSTVTRSTEKLSAKMPNAIRSLHRDSRPYSWIDRKISTPFPLTIGRLTEITATTESIEHIVADARGKDYEEEIVFKAGEATKIG